MAMLLGYYCISLMKDKCLFKYETSMDLVSSKNDLKAYSFCSDLISLLLFWYYCIACAKHLKKYKKVNK